MRVLWLVGSLWLCFGSIASAQTESPGFDSYWKGDIRTALVAFEQVTVEHPNRYGAWYNYGTAAARLGETGKAIYGLERALRLKPNAADALTNLALVKKNAIEAFADKESEEPVVLPALERSGSSLFRLYRPNLMNLVFAVCWALFLVAFLVARRAAASRLRTSGFFFALVFFLISLGVATLRIGRSHWVDESVQAVVTKGASVARQGPGTHYRTVTRILDGVTVDVLGQQDEWTLVEFGNSRTAWISTDSLMRLPNQH
jgi:hypothetical protein